MKKDAVSLVMCSFLVENTSLTLDRIKENSNAITNSIRMDINTSSCIQEVEKSLYANLACLYCESSIPPKNDPRYKILSLNVMKSLT